jgi:hypothetical protein
LGDWWQEVKPRGFELSTPSEPRGVEITFGVTVPALVHEEPVFIAGDFGPQYPRWDPPRLPRVNVGGRLWSITLRLQPGNTVSYKYTLGIWEPVEQTAACSDLPDRSYTVPASGPATVNDTVAVWRNRCA